MQHIGSLFSKREAPIVQDRRTERGELLSWFTENINAERDGVKYKKLSIGAVAVKLQKLNLQDLYYMKAVLNDRSPGYPFGKAFWGMLKARD